MKTLFIGIVLTTLSFSVHAQTYEQNQVDSLLRIVNNPNENNNTSGSHWIDYYKLGSVYKEMKQWEQAAGAFEKSLDAYQQYTNNHSEEQRQLNDTKFDVLKQQQQIKQQQRKDLYTLIEAFFVIVLLLGVIMLLNRQKKIYELEKEKARLTAEKALAEKEKINEQLITYLAELTRKDRLLDKAKFMDSQQLNKMISQEQKTAKVTEDYAKLFREIRTELYERLSEQAAPNKLSKTDLKYCAYISLRMSNKELANVMNVGYRTAASQKYNLKKKLHLTEDDSLDEFIIGLATH